MARDYGVSRVHAQSYDVKGAAYVREPYSAVLGNGAVRSTKRTPLTPHSVQATALYLAAGDTSLPYSMISVQVESHVEPSLSKSTSKQSSTVVAKHHYPLSSQQPAGLDLPTSH